VGGSVPGAWRFGHWQGAQIRGREWEISEGKGELK
jgi:hypothetical protein